MIIQKDENMISIKNHNESINDDASITQSFANKRQKTNAKISHDESIDDDASTTQSFANKRQKTNAEISFSKDVTIHSIN